LAVTLMTVHSAKGLEFERVYLTGMEERVFPHARVIDDERSMEEERRLAYVAFTRARRNLTVTMAAGLRLFAQIYACNLSRLVGTLPANTVLTSGGRGPPARPSVVARRAGATPGPTGRDDVVYAVDPDIGPEVMVDERHAHGEEGE